MKDNIINTNSLEIFKNNVYNKFDIGNVSNNAYLSIVATNKCQKDCFYCINSCTDKKTDIPIDKAINNIEKVVDKYKIKEAILLGGEPLLHKNIFQLIKKIRNNTNLEEILLTTNGIMLKNNEDFIKKLVDKKNGISKSINISFHNEEFITLKELKWIYKKIKKHNGNIKVRINVNIWKGNNDTLDSLLKIIRDVNFADEIRVSNLIPKDDFSVNPTNDKKNCNKILSDKKYISLFKKLIKYYSDYYTIINNDRTLGFVRYLLIPTPCPIIINWNIGSDVSKQVCENYDRKINTFKCLVSGDISLSWNLKNIIKCKDNK